MKLRNLLFSVVVIPISMPKDFVHLKYEEIKPNKVSLEKVVEIKVDSTASPLFYKMPKPMKLKSIEVEGEVNIEKKIDSKEDDSYFQLGIIYEGDYRPSGFVKKFLPEWLLKVLSINDEFGVGYLDFHEASADGKKLDKEDSIRDIKLKFKTATEISENQFKFSIKTRDEKVLGFWLRADGDESKASFKTTLKSLKTLQ